MLNEIKAAANAGGPLVPREERKRDVTILIVDDEENICEYCGETLLEAGFRTVFETTYASALDRLRREQLGILLVDMKLPDGDGIALIREAKRLNPNIEAILMTAYTSIESAVAALKSGAFDYIPKPFDKEMLVLSCERCVDKFFLNLENVQLKEIISIGEVTQAMSSMMDVNVLVEFALETVLDMLRATSGSIMLFDEHDQVLRVACQVGLRDEVDGSVAVKLGERIAGWVAQHQEPLILQSITGDARFNALQPRDNIVSSICVPLSFWQKLIGVMNINREELPVPFTRTDLEVSSIIAGQIAIAIEHSRTVERLRAAAGAAAPRAPESSPGA